VFIGFDLNVLEICGKMEPEGGIAERTFSTNGNLQCESVSIWSIPVMKFLPVAMSFFALLDEDAQIVEPP
jgi:hypothetical protein